MQQFIERGATSQIVHLFVGDASVATGAGLTGLAHNSSGLSGRTIRTGEALSSALSFEAIAALGAYQAPSSSGHLRIREIDGAQLPGWYELHLPDAWLQTTGDRRSLIVQMRGVANMRQTNLEVLLLDPVRGLGSPKALPNAAAEAAGGLFTRGAGVGQIDQRGPGTILADPRGLSQLVCESAGPYSIQFTVGSAPTDKTIMGWNLIEITNGPPQTVYVQEYEPSTRTAVVAALGLLDGAGDWPRLPSPGDRFSLFPSSAAILEQFAFYMAQVFNQTQSAVWDVLLNDHQAAGTAGRELSRLAAIQARTDSIVAGRTTVVSPVAPDGRQIVVVSGDDYSAIDGRSLDFSDDADVWPDLTGASVVLSIGFTDSIFRRTGLVVAPTGSTKRVRFELSSAQTSQFEARRHIPFDVEAALAGGNKITLAIGRCTVLADVG
jgi:hypothetical protein